MRASEALPNHFTIPMIVASCAELELVNYGRSIHGLVSKLGLFSGSSAVGSSFVYMYSKCGVLEEAYGVFDEILFRDVVAWTALVIGCVQNGESKMGLECLCEMHRIGGDGERPNFRTLEGGFQACGNLGALLEGRCLHGLVVKTGMDYSQVVQSLLLSMYSKCGNPEEAHRSFCEVLNKDIISWTSMISAYSRMGWATECIDMFWEMLVSGIYPDGIVISCMLSSFSNSMRVEVLCRVNEQNFEAWNLMVSGYGKIGLIMKCIGLFREMQCLGIESDSNSLVSVVSSCSQLGATHLARSIHCYMIKNLMDENVSVNNSLIDMYGKSGNLTIARRIFCRIPRDIVTWNTLISSYAHCGHFAEALSLYDKMVLEDLKPNSATLVSVLSACSHLASLEEGEKVHNYINGGKFEFNLSIATALIDMYAKCGQLEKSREIFNSMHERDVITWNVMISGYGMHGDARSAIEFFQQMEESSAKPNGLTFLAVLSACAHAGLVKEGKYLFGKMQDYSVAPNLKHYACMVDLLGRSGNLQEAEALVLSMPISPDGGVWGALLSSCKIHNEIEMGIRIAKHAIDSDVENDGYYVMISNMYSSIGKWRRLKRQEE
ncbi:Pentatricopeptide repeat-containing protein, mitochondrial [Vitis vinifera]|uniref:Pentatricopeptide repeat-containing protein, mitochondrial n=1 Tax=Vitis vinifera TaxID=29760 RepID=A0A438CR16_VITVI|nr:Pentatricopeptide repeat-containing protein, mitochondrial [Vitis vinifera]